MRPALRALGTLTFSALFLILSGHPAGAFELRLVATTPTTNVEVGEVVSFDAYLDTQGADGIVLFSASLSFDSAGFAYREDLSDNTNDLLFYYPGTGPSNPAYWLEANTDKPAQWPGNSGPDQYNLDFLIQPDGALIDGKSTVGTATNLYLSTLAFEATAPGTFFFDWALDKGGNVFSIAPGATEITDQVSMVGSTFVTVVPEPGTALLVGMGLLALGRVARRS